jgi:hypothetical protein
MAVSVLDTEDLNIFARNSVFDKMRRLLFLFPPICNHVTLKRA